MKISQFADNKPRLLLIGFGLGGTFASLDFLPESAKPMGGVLFLMLLAITIGFIIIVLKNPKNHTNKFVTTIFTSLYLGILLPLLLKQDTETVFFSAIWIGLLLLLAYSLLQNALSPDNQRKKFHPILFSLACLGACFIFGIVGFLQGFLFFVVICALIIWAFQWFLTPISHKVLIYKIVNVVLMVIFLVGLVEYQQAQIKAQGDNVLQQVLLFKQKNGNYPKREQITLEQNHKVFYDYNPSQSAQPVLSYATVRDPYCRINFDFVKNAWHAQCTE